MGGGVVATTEPVPAYLLAELGLDDETPAEFTEAIEEGADVPPLALQPRGIPTDGHPRAAPLAGLQ